MAFNPEDYIVERRISARHLGRQQPNYRVSHIAKKAGPDDTISDEVHERMKTISSTGGRKRKRTSAGGQVETSSPVKRLRPSGRAMGATSIPALEYSTPSTKGKIPASPKTTSARRTSKKSNVAKDAAEQEQIPGVLSPPQTPTVSKPGAPQEDQSRDLIPESPDIVAAHERPEEQILTPESSCGNLEISPRKGQAGHTTGHPEQDAGNSASVASSSSLSSLPSSTVSPQMYTRLLTEAIPSSPRSHRYVRPIQRYGAFVETPAGEDGDAESGEEEPEAAPQEDAEEEVNDEDSSALQQRGRRRKATATLQSTSKRRKQLTVIVSGNPSPESTDSPSLIAVLPISLPATPVPDDAPAGKLKRARPSSSSSTPRPKVSRPQKRAALPPAAAANEPDLYSELDSTVDARLIELSLRLTQRDPLQSKYRPNGEPEVWADSRQALCETVPYFKKPQGGCHQNDRHTYAFLFDNVGHCREYMDSDVIIARAGGSMEFDSSTGGMIQKKDHLMCEAQVQSVVNDIQLQNPLVIICGDKNQGAICKMPHRYNVLGWYKPIDVWAEKTCGKGTRIWATIKYRFERLGASAKAAWHETGSIVVTDEDRRVAGPLTRQTCWNCQHDFPKVYLVGWMCLNQDCLHFWKLPNGDDAGYGKLHYNPAFLLHRSPWAVEAEPFSVRPPIPIVGNVVGDNLTKINTRGICCPQCGRCSSRRLFKGWRCDNSRCNYENFPKHIPVKIPMLHQPWENTGDGPALARNKHEKGVKVHVSYIHGFKVYTYTFEGINGKFVHAASNALINRQPGYADEMFTAIQNQDDPEMDMHLERRRFGVEKNSGSKAPAAETETRPDPIAEDGDGEGGKKAELEDGDFMTAFSMNYGMPYKFVASGSSMSFTDAPWPVRACRADLNWASQTFLDKKNHVDLNEELIFAYMEGQKIEYHDDGESGLGPRITTLSLGGKAKMHMRMKMKHFVGCSKTGILTAERPVPGGIDGPEMYQKRLDAWNELQAIKDTEKPLYERRRKEIPKELGLYGKRMKKAEDAVTITLSHGDIVAMEGYEIQQYLEHKVVPEGPLRFALTCRTVLPDHLKPEELPSYEVSADDESMSSLRKMAAAQGQQQAS